MGQSLFVSTALTWGIDLHPEQIESFIRFQKLLIEANERVNLTRVELEQVESLHFLDSLRIGVELSLSQTGSMLDIGSGAGFPALPLALTYPELVVHILDASERRLDFIEYASRQLGLSNITLHHGRAEELAHQVSLRESFPLVTARALAPLPKLIELVLPFVSLNGKAALLRTDDKQETEKSILEGIHLLGGTLEDSRAYTLPGKEEIRSLLLLSKESPTPATYPRSKKKMDRASLA